MMAPPLLSVPVSHRCPSSCLCWCVFSERCYDGAKFHQRAFAFPFDDHNAPPLLSVLSFCQHATDWLSLHPDNVIAVHCKAGKGRTGLMVACLLLYSGLCRAPEEALAYFGERRTANGKGVTIPSQQRFVTYFHQLLTGWGSGCTWRGFDWDGEPHVLHSLELLHLQLPSDQTPFAVLLNQQKQLLLDTRSMQPHPSPLTLPLNLPVRGEFKVIIYLGPLPSHPPSPSFPRPPPPPTSSDKVTELCHFWLHSTFLPSSSYPPPPLLLAKAELDKVCKDRKHKKVGEGFGVRVNHSPAPDDGGRGGEGGGDEEWFGGGAEGVGGVGAVVEVLGTGGVGGGMGEDVGGRGAVQAAQYKAADFIRRCQVMEGRYAVQEAELERAKGVVAELRAEISRQRERKKAGGEDAADTGRLHQQPHIGYGEEDEEDSEDEED